MPRNLAKSATILALLAAVSVVSCGPPGEEPLSPPIGSIIGAWEITEAGFVSDPRCIPPGNPYILYLGQNGSTVTAEVGFDTTVPLSPTIGSDGTLFTGMISGSTLNLSGSNPDGMGTMTTARVATVAPSCNSLTGERTLFYTEPGGFSCSNVMGKITFTGTRTVGSGCPGTLAATAVPESTTAHDTAVTAQPVTRPAEVSGTISSGVDDWYSFDLIGAAAVTILLNGPAAPQNIDLALFDNAGTTQLASSTSASSREAIADTLAGGLTYRIRVRSTAVTGTQSYTLLVQ